MHLTRARSLGSNPPLEFLSYLLQFETVWLRCLSRNQYLSFFLPLFQLISYTLLSLLSTYQYSALLLVNLEEGMEMELKGKRSLLSVNVMERKAQLLLPVCRVLGLNADDIHSESSQEK